ncbi:MAG: 4Fe-4S binding protein [Myxococcales bacterium]|nr:4Fe-4S binding protein [Myxococcales bacterium]
MTVFASIGFLLGLAVVLASLLALANARLRVEEDPRIDDVEQMLPGNNCGACGMPGCRAFAEATVAGSIAPSACTVGPPEMAQEVADYLGIEAGSREPTVARLLCAGGRDVAGSIGDYQGHASCRAVSVTGSSKGCTWGCLGLGDCEVVCTFDAIVMGPTGLPIVDLDKCTSCGDCVRICPRGLFEIVPVAHHLLVQCKSELEGDRALDLCKVACTGCGKCAADAAAGLVSMRKNLPMIDDERRHLESPTATLRCPTAAIRWVEGQQFPEHVAKMRGTEQTAPASTTDSAESKHVV